MKITLDFLVQRGACYEGQELFRELFGEEAELNEENIEKYVKANRYAHTDIRWLADELLWFGDNSSNWREFYRFYYFSNLKSDTNNFARAIGKKFMQLMEKK